MKRKIIQWLGNRLKPSQEELVLALVLHTASLELAVGESIELAPIRGTCGPFKLYGNSLPIFTYRVFEKQIMEFILVRVEIARPNQIRFVSTIDSATAPERHGEFVFTKEKYKEPFHQLAQHLYRYFPYYKRSA